MRRDQVDEVVAAHEPVERIGIVIGVPSLNDMFDESNHSQLPGGILESFGLGAGTSGEFVGLQNYARILTSSRSCDRSKMRIF